jgi:hypothetical protein
VKELVKKLGTLYGLVGSISVLIPGLSFFLKYSPPLFAQISILICALSAAFLWLGFKTIDNQRLKVSAIKYILVGFILTISYLVVLDMTSIRVTDSVNDVRYQVGWNLASWNLKDSAKRVITQKICPDDNKEDLLYCYTVSQHSVNLIWEQWSIYLFGILNIILFTLSSLSWSYGWGQLIKADK